MSKYLGISQINIEVNHWYGNLDDSTEFDIRYRKGILICKFGKVAGSSNLPDCKIYVKVKQKVLSTEEMYSFIYSQFTAHLY